jgi:hypothetical protein
VQAGARDADGSSDDDMGVYMSDLLFHSVFCFFRLRDENQMATMQ